MDTFLARTFDNPLYIAWCNMRKRCRTRANYKRKGVSVAIEWEDFENFARDMHPRPSGMSLERKDNLKGYSKENCVWATGRQQQNNMERNHKVTYRGEIKTVAEWSRLTGLPYRCLSHRINRGWAVSRALETPILIDRRAA